jgi:hypothetical protein
MRKSITHMKHLKSSATSESQQVKVIPKSPQAKSIFKSPQVKIILNHLIA